jgi:SAM-dependent methyltransferase
MAARSSELSVAVARNIVSFLDPLPSEPIVDVGCGDGALLHLLKGDRIGISPNPEEIAKLRSLWPDVRFEAALAQSLPLSDGSVSTLLCHCVLLALETEIEGRKAIAEFARVCRAGASMLLGEVPIEPVQSEYRHDSVRVWLWSLLTRGGPRHFAAGARDVAKAATGDTPLLFYPERWFHCERERFVALCADFGLRLVRDRTSPHVTSRRDYLLLKE